MPSTLVDCGTVYLRGLGERRVVSLDGVSYMWDQDALDRKFGLGKYLFSYRPKFDLHLDPWRYREHKPQTDDMKQMLDDLKGLPA